ncbi:MAG: hypothetical protein MRY79_07655 [Alphaproteobacteria bacterium]|nr:hypothetical protein [Alphaproteobacteria bacterium]
MAKDQITTKLKNSLIETFGQKAWEDFARSYGKTVSNSPQAIAFHIRSLKARSNQPEFSAK